MSILDRWYSYFGRKKLDLWNTDTSFNKVIYDTHHEKAAMFFLGWKTNLKDVKKLFSYFRNYKKIIYQLPKACLTPEPSIGRKGCDVMAKDVDKTLKEQVVEVVYGLSMGCSMAAYAANRSKNVKKLLLALPAERITTSTWEGIYTRPVKVAGLKLGFTKDDFYKAMKPYDPVENIDNLEGKTIRILLGRADEVIPHRHGMALVKKMRQQGLHPEVIHSPFGHFLTAAVSFYFMKRFYV